MKSFTWVKRAFLLAMTIGVGMLLSSVISLMSRKEKSSIITSSPPEDVSINNMKPRMKSTVTFTYTDKTITQLKDRVRQKTQNEAVIRNGVKENENIWPRNFKDNYKLCLFYNVGKLGNQISEYASLIGMSKNKDLVPYVDVSVYKVLNKVFHLTIPSQLVTNASKHCSGNRFRSTRSRGSSLLERDCIDALQTPLRTNYKLQGFHQSWMYFYNYQSEIRQEFTFRENIKLEATEAIRKAVEGIISRYSKEDRKDITYVGVHLRRMLDFKTYKDYGIVTPPAPYYRRAMQFYMNRYKKVVFIVCSNGIKWAKENLKSFPTVFIEPQSERPEIDICILSQCNHSIISVGSFSFWSAFLANGDVIYFKTPFAIGSDYSKKYSKHLTDFYLPYWIPME